MAPRFNPPPGWPPAPDGFAPPPGWQPDPSWPPAPPGWQWWVDSDEPPAGSWPPGSAAAATAPAPAAAWPGYGATPGYPGQPPAGSRTSGWAIASLIFGLIGGVVLSVIFGIVALRRTKRLGQRGRGLAIAGLALSGAWVVVIVIVVVVNLAGTAMRSASGTITHRGTLDVTSLRTGDCFDNSFTSGVITTVTAVPCTEPHNAQVYASFTLAGSAFPGDAQAIALAKTGCEGRVASSVDPARVRPDFLVRFLRPNQDAWNSGDHTVNCVIVAPRPTLTASVLKPGHG